MTILCDSFQELLPYDLLSILESDLYLMTDCELVKASYWYLEHQGKRQNGVAKCLSFDNPKIPSLLVPNLSPSVILPVALWLISNTLLTSVSILS